MLLGLDNSEVELPFLGSVFCFLGGLLSFLGSLDSLEVLPTDFLSTLVSFFSECTFLLGSLVLGSLDSGFSSP